MADAYVYHRATAMSREFSSSPRMLDLSKTTRMSVARAFYVLQGDWLKDLSKQAS